MFAHFGRAAVKCVQPCARSAAATAIGFLSSVREGSLDVCTRVRAGQAPGVVAGAVSSTEGCAGDATKVLLSCLRRALWCSRQCPELVLCLHISCLRFMFVSFTLMCLRFMLL